MNTIIQEAEFKAGEYGELVIVGQPVIEAAFFDFYPKGVYGEPPEAPHREKGPPLGWRQTPPTGPSSGGSDGSVTLPPSTVAPARAASENDEPEPEPEGLAEAFAEPRMVLYCSNSPRDGWKRIGEFKAHIYTEQVRKVRFYRIIHPKGCPFEGKVTVVGKTI